MGNTFKKQSQQRQLPLEMGNTAKKQSQPPAIAEIRRPGRRGLKQQGSWHGAGLARGSHAFGDDEGLEHAEAAAPQPEAETIPDGPLTLSTRLEYKSLKKNEAYNVFGLVSLHAAEAPEEPAGASAAGAGQRASVDIVCVLDVSGSMSGEKVQLVKEAVRFVVGEMLAGDRLSIVSFNHEAERHTRLTRMSQAGKDEAQQAVMRLQADGGTSIANGLDCGIAVMEQRRQRNPVGAVFLLTDGKDSSSRGEMQQLVDRARAARCSVYPFGFGADHDTAVLSAISETAQTPFTFVEQPHSIKEAFAGAVAGLMSVAAQAIELRIEPQGGCALVAVHTHFPQRREAGAAGAAVVSVPDAFEGERRDFVVELRVPAAAGAADGQEPIFRASARYLAVRERAPAQTPVVCLEVARSAEPEGEPDVEVVAQRQRVEVTDALERAIAHGEAGRFDEARKELGQHEAALRGSRVQTEVTLALLAEVQDAQQRVSSEQAWRRGGHAEVADALHMNRSQRCTNVTRTSGDVAKSSKSMYLSSKQLVSVRKAAS